MTNGRHIKTLYFQLQESMKEFDGELGCHQVPDVFFPEDYKSTHMRTEATKMAVKLCKECPIQLECLAYAKEAKEEWGVWGGTTPRQR